MERKIRYQTVARLSNALNIAPAMKGLQQERFGVPVRACWRRPKYIMLTKKRWFQVCWRAVTFAVVPFTGKFPWLEQAKDPVCSILSASVGDQNMEAWGNYPQTSVAPLFGACRSRNRDTKHFALYSVLLHIALLKDLCAGLLPSLHYRIVSTRARPMHRHANIYRPIWRCCRRIIYRDYLLVKATTPLFCTE